MRGRCRRRRCPSSRRPASLLCFFVAAWAALLRRPGARRGRVRRGAAPVFCSGAPCFLGPFGLPFGGQPRTMSRVASAPVTGRRSARAVAFSGLLSERCDEGRLLNRGGVACRRAGPPIMTLPSTHGTARPSSTHVLPGDGPPLAQLRSARIRCWWGTVRFMYCSCRRGPPKDAYVGLQPVGSLGCLLVSLPDR